MVSLAILKLTPLSLLIEGIWEDLLTDIVVRKQDTFNLFFPNPVKKWFKKRKKTKKPHHK